jgi:hypothetical protein
VSEPDITETIDGVTVTTVIEAVEITRQGKDGGWRVSLPLTKTGTLGSNTFTIPASSVTYDLDDLAHDPAVPALYAALRDVTIRIARGDLKPLPQATP